MMPNDGHSHLKFIQITFGYRSTPVFAYSKHACRLTKIALRDPFRSSTDHIGGQIWVLGVNFRAEFEFNTENDQKRQFKAVLRDLLRFNFFKKIQIAYFDEK